MFKVETKVLFFRKKFFCLSWDKRAAAALQRPGVNFINVLRTAFVLVEPESIRTQSSCQYLFALLGSASVKAVYRMLKKSTPCINFTNILCAAFVPVDP